jgi:hypothetical protein
MMHHRFSDMGWDSNADLGPEEQSGEFNAWFDAHSKLYTLFREARVFSILSPSTWGELLINPDSYAWDAVRTARRLGLQPTDITGYLTSITSSHGRAVYALNSIHNLEETANRFSWASDQLHDAIQTAHLYSLAGKGNISDILEYTWEKCQQHGYSLSDYNTIVSAYTSAAGKEGSIGMVNVDGYNMILSMSAGLLTMELAAGAGMTPEGIVSHIRDVKETMDQHYMRIPFEDLLDAIKVRIESS